jgi:predicted dehydrogenase
VGSLRRRSFLELSAASLAALAAAGITLKPGRAWPQGAAKKVRLGVVGGGYGAHFYWHEHPHCTVTGVAELRAGRRARLARVYRCRAEYDSFERMLKEAKDIDAVAIFSGADDHARHVIMALERGWHVVCAVPACQSLDEARALADAVKKSGRRYMMAETSWYRQPAIFARELVRQKTLGRIFYTEAQYYHDRGDLERLVTDTRARFFDDKGRRTWRWGLPPMFYPTHATGFVVGVTGERITRVSCLGWGTRDHPWLTENRYANPFWNQSALMQTSGGAILRCNVFWLAAAEGERAAWYGDGGTFHMAAPELHADTLTIRARGKRPVKVPRYWQLDLLPPAMRHDAAHDGAETFLSAEFINALVEDREPAIGLAEALAMTVPGLVAHQSALRSGEQLPVPELL